MLNISFEKEVEGISTINSVGIVMENYSQPGSMLQINSSEFTRGLYLIEIESE